MKELAGATVFLDNALKGTVTNSDGTFVLANIQPGYYNIVVTYLGYKSAIRKILINQNQERLEFQLRPDIKILSSVIIKPSLNKELKKAYFNLFVRDFIGGSFNAARCKILNPEILNFDYNKENNILNVSADSILIIDNQILGYRLKIMLQSFTAEYNLHLVTYTGHIIFEEMEGSTAQKNQWQRNRMETYLGSYRHFYRSLSRRTVSQNGFEMHPVIYDKTPDEKIEKFEKMGPAGADSLRYWKWMQSIPQKAEVSKSILKEEDVVRAAAQEGLYELSFDKHLYLVSKKKKSSISGYTNILIDLNTSSTLFDSNGILINPLHVTYRGQSVEKIADKLPFNFVPDNEPAPGLRSDTLALSAAVADSPIQLQKLNLSDTLLLKDVVIYANKGTRTILDTAFTITDTGHRSKYLIEYVLEKIPGAVRNPANPNYLAFYGLSPGTLAQEQSSAETLKRNYEFKNASLEAMRKLALAYGPVLPRLSVSPAFREPDGSVPDYYYISVDKIKEVRLIHRYVAKQGDTFELKVELKP